MRSLQIPLPVVGARLLRVGVLLAAMMLGGVASVCAREGDKLFEYFVGGYIIGSPAMSPKGDAIYVGVITRTAGQVVALTPAGKPLWDHSLPASVDSTPAVAPDGTIYIGCVDGRLYALNPGVNVNKRVKWTAQTVGFVSSSPAVGSDGTIYFGSADGQLHAVHPEDGKERWAFPTRDLILSSPAIGDDGTIYIGSRDNNLYAVNPDGTWKWEFPTGRDIWGSPAIGRDGTIYIGSQDQKVYAIAPDGAKRWDYFTNGAIDASPVLGADGTVYIASADTHFYALNPTGPDEQRVKWAKEIRVTSASSAAVRGDGTIIFAADDNRVRALDPDGNPDRPPRWTFTATQSDGEFMESSPLIAPDGSIFVGSSDGFLYKLEGNGSPLSAASSWPSFHRDLTRTGQAAPATGQGRLINLSARTRMSGDEPARIVGFYVFGSTTKAYLVRAVGPTLTQFGVGGFMPDPRLQVFANGQLKGENDNWRPSVPGEFNVADTSVGVGAFPLIDGSKDAAMVIALPTGSYTTHTTSNDGVGGVVLVEAYDSDVSNTEARLVNLSTRGQVGADPEDNLFVGFAVGGTGPTRLLLRGVGPGLTQFGVSGALQRPRMTLYAQQPNGPPKELQSNSDWAIGGLHYDLVAAGASVAAFPLVRGSADAAMIVTVNPGLYTIQIAGMNSTTGEALAEIYVLP